MKNLLALMLSSSSFWLRQPNTAGQELMSMNGLN